MPGPKRKSIVWDVFESSSVSERVRCKQCSDTFKYSGNTTTLLNHIKKKHPTTVAIEECQSSTFTNEGNTSIPVDSSSSQLQVSTSTLNVEPEPPQKRLRHIHQTRLTVPKKITQDSGDKALINLIVKDLQPFQIVENSGFCEYSKALNADYQLPNRKKLALMVDEKYKLVSESLKHELHDISYLALTSDIWTSDKDIVMLLRPFENVTVILSGEKYPSLSSVIPLVLGLQNAIENKAPVTELGTNLKR
ncbi:hypothetical protein SFRURICE_013308, partial [Spodoptera frugiperda]